MKSTGIGDMALATAIVRDVVDRFPEAQVVIFAGADNAGIARLVDGAEVVELPTAKPWAALPLIRAEKLDVMLDLGQWTRLEAVYTALSGARWTAGFATAGQRRHHAYDATVPHSSTIPEIDNYRAVAAALGVNPDSLPAVRGDRSGPLRSDPRAVRRLPPLARWLSKRPSRVAAGPLAQAGRDRRGARGRGSADRRPRGRAAHDGASSMTCGGPTEKLASIAGECGLAELIEVLDRARCVVSVNTGVMHLAAAAGTWTIALNGPTNSRRVGSDRPAERERRLGTARLRVPQSRVRIRRAAHRLHEGDYG